ncbi:hypothetical protein [Spiroplasma endosymbiont of Polydrusus pterygomalis]|uniref:hypothetical protein n=1 Tax=Spiroplasma endosymbiont of Polydrusus pterygomalis TaxID=3139327 RepID=UPI003CCAC148
MQLIKKTVASWYENFKKGILNTNKGQKESFKKRDLNYYKVRYELLKKLHDFYNLAFKILNRQYKKRSWFIQ